MLPILAQQTLSSWLQTQQEESSASPINVEELYTMFEHVMDPHFYENQNKKPLFFGGGGGGGYGGTTKCCATGTCDNGPRFPG